MLGNTTLKSNESLKLSYNLYDGITRKIFLDGLRDLKSSRIFNVQITEYTSDILIENFYLIYR